MAQYTLNTTPDIIAEIDDNVQKFRENSDFKLKRSHVLSIGAQICSEAFSQVIDDAEQIHSKEQLKASLIKAITQ